MLTTFALMITGPPWYWAPAAPAKANRLTDSNATDTIFLRKVLSSTRKGSAGPPGPARGQLYRKGCAARDKVGRRRPRTRRQSQTRFTERARFPVAGTMLQQLSQLWLLSTSTPQ